MPPRPRRETPDRRDQRIRKHVAQAREYWAKGHQHLLEQDTCQAAEKGWGTVAQLTKAVATLRGWDHYDHIAVRECVLALAAENPDFEREIHRRLLIAEGLHGQFYEIYMTHRTTWKLPWRTWSRCWKSCGASCPRTTRAEGPLSRRSRLRFRLPPHTDLDLGPR